MNEINQILEPKEKLFYDSNPVYKPYLLSSLIAAIIFSAIIGVFAFAFSKSIIIGIIILIAGIVGGIILANMAYSRTHYAITNKRVIIQSGIIGRDYRSIDYDRMQNISVDVGPLGVMFKVGSIKIFTGELQSTGGKNPQLKPKYDMFKYISEPYNVLKTLQTQLSARKEKL